MKENPMDYGRRFLSSSYIQLVRDADRYFGGLCLLNLALAVIGWLRGTVPAQGMFLIALFIAANIFMSRLASRSPESSRVTLELVRIFAVNGLLSPLLLVGVGGALHPWWTGYYISCLGSAVLLGAAFPANWWIGTAGTLFWAVNLMLAGSFGLHMHPFALINQAGALAMISFVFLRYTQLFIGRARSEHGRFEEALAGLTQAQAQLVESGKLAALGQMAGGIAHEINSPLAAVQLAVKQIRRGIEQDPIDRVRVLERTATIQEVTDRIGGIVAGLRAFCKDGSSDPTRRVPIQAVISDTLVFCEERFRLNGIRLEILNACKQAEVECRPVQLSQVLLNLLNNSFDAVRLAPSREVALEVAEEGDWVRVSVEDSGCGIPEADRTRIFEPFFTTKGALAGTGLGLSISRRIVEEHGGTLELDRAAARTRFVMRMPGLRRASADRDLPGAADPAPILA